MSEANTLKIIDCAGAVVLRQGLDGVREVLAIHRPKYDDWSLPKGKLLLGEVAPAAAVREVFEEASTMIVLRAPLDQTRYSVGRSTDKQISWWQAEAIETQESGRPLTQQRPGSVPEVDELSWLPADDAPKVLDYEHDHGLVQQALDQPATTPVILLRHAKAVGRKDWGGPDTDRPLRARGKVQSRRLVPLLSAYGVQELISSPWMRCSATLHPYALQHRIEPTLLDVMNEEAATEDPDAVITAMNEIAERAVAEHRPVAICGHRPGMPYLLKALDLPDRPFATAECLVAHLTDTGEVHAVELHRPRA